MKQFKMIMAVAIFFVFATGCGSKRSGMPRILVFSKTKEYRHKSIPNGIAAIQKLGRENGFIVDTTENSGLFNEDSLKQYSAVVFLNTTGDVLDQYQQAEFERYIQAGGGFMGIHSATDCEYRWPWYGQLVGAYFKSHPEIQPAKIIVKDKNHPSTKHLSDIWERTDEWYNFRIPPSDSTVKVLLAIDETSYKGGENGANHPMAWYHEFDGGRAFYTELGHTEETYAEPDYLKHILGGIQYVIGKNEALDYSKSTSMKVPEEDRFSKTLLATGFDEPIEMAILPNLDILVVQRKGEIMFYDHTTKNLSQVAKLNAFFKATVPDVNAEEGVLGITADPDYAKNNYVYIFYSPFDTSVNRLSRFVFSNGKFDVASEKVILQFYSQRNICCHTGGSVTFGKDRELFVSAGDNSTPFDQPNSKYQLRGFGPLDDRPGFEQYDARRSASNSNDLRGKIMRIHINEDGSYTVPEGNLFPKGMDKTRPEIYVMGDRNPYRISVDRKTGFLYWGEVGPDAGNDSLDTRGPRGYDELNQARKAGYFGWPLFVGKNYPYRKFNYATGEVGEPFDPMKPVNDSRNNTGIRELPAVAPPFIWYPYAASTDFPEVGTGGRNAMAGPIYYPEFYPKETRLPDYYNGKLFFYDWIRGWIRTVTMNAAGDFVKMDPFMPNTRLNSLIDMEMGPDGRLYFLEYGTGWFTKNPDAGLSRIDYNAGNRPPKVEISVDKISGGLPFTVNASAEGTRDPDKDALTYIWHFGKETKETKETKTSYTFNTAGDYNISVEVKDDKGATGKSEVKPVYAGNEMPLVSIQLEGNPKFFFPGQPVKYKVTVNDREDGTVIDPSNLFVKMDYVSGMDKAQVVGHQVVSSNAVGKAIMESGDCKTCHKVNEKSIGPAFTAVADKYAKDPKASEYLVNKIKKGGSGVWGETAMAAHPDLKTEDLQKIVGWVLSLHQSAAVKSLPAEGVIVPAEKDVAGGKAMQLTAMYTDKGGAGIKALTGGDVAMLRSPVLGPQDNTGLNGISVMEFGGMKLAIMDGESGWIAFDGVNLEGAKTIEITYMSQKPFTKGYVVELFEGNVTGRKIAEVALAVSKPMMPNVVQMALPPGVKTVRPVFRLRKADPSETTSFAVSGFRLK